MKQEIVPIAELRKKTRGRRNKFNARSIVIDGHKFPSLAEGAQYVRLTNSYPRESITLHPRFKLRRPDGRHLCYYTADSLRVTSSGQLIVQDVKGVRSRELGLKLKLVEDQYHIKVRLITKKDLPQGEVKSLLAQAAIEGRIGEEKGKDK
jgi:hypothetical protein